MQTYKAPLRDMRFVLHELHDSAALTQLRGLEDVSPELMDQHPRGSRQGRRGSLAADQRLGR